jgi:DNA helicase HerA-like ATPase
VVGWQKTEKMSKAEDFRNHINEGYSFEGDFITLGSAILDGEPVGDANVKIPLSTLNRHGLIAGATGTGKTKSLQVLAEEMSLKGIPSLLMDLKGDLSGLGKPGETNKHIEKRAAAMGIPYKAQQLLVELFSISEGKGTRMKATVSEFGSPLLAKIFGLNETQSGILAILFKYCDDNDLPLLDLKDLRKSLQFMIGDGKEEIKEEYGQVSSASVNTIMRKIIELEGQGGELFFGERSFDVSDLLFTNSRGIGQISILRLTDIQSKPKLFSTFMLSLLAELYETLPEAGDDDKPKLCMFIDEAHLVFDQASDELLDQIEVIIKLIRSKGVGIFFCTQLPTDIPDVVLSQLGLKVQHALRAFTAKDRKAIKSTAENYPLSDYYETDEIITALGIGEALITGLNEKGIPTPLAATLMRGPATRMDILTPVEIDEIVDYSTLTEKYNKEIDRRSAYEILSEKMDKAKAKERQEEIRAAEEKERKVTEKKLRKSAPKKRKSSKRKTTSTRRTTSSRQSDSIGDTLIKELTRGLFGILGMKR